MNDALTENQLWEALDGLHAYDVGSTDSGIHDEALRAAVIAQMKGMDDTARRFFLARRIREHFLSERALEQGYGLEDAARFWIWLDETMGCAA
jgi:hypothetical protein